MLKSLDPVCKFDAALRERLIEAICGAGAQYIPEPLSLDAYGDMADAALMEITASCSTYVLDEAGVEAAIDAHKREETELDNWPGYRKGHPPERLYIEADQKKMRAAIRAYLAIGEK